MTEIKKLPYIGCVFLLVCLLTATTFAEQEEKDREIDFNKPIIYSSSLMLVGYGALVASDEIENPAFRNFKHAFSEGPESDDDSDAYNFILHPLWGSETYLRAREANFGGVGSVIFSTAASFAWEYLIESWSSHPSTQDLLITPTLGSVLGEIRYKLKQRNPDKYHWFVDPIYTTLKHFNIGVTSDSKGKKVPVANVEWEF